MTQDPPPPRLHVAVAHPHAETAALLVSALRYVGIDADLEDSASQSGDVLVVDDRLTAEARGRRVVRLPVPIDLPGVVSSVVNAAPAAARVTPAAAASGLPGRLRVGGVELDESSQRVLREGRPVHLTATEFRLLRELMRSPGEVRPRHELLQAVWAYDFGGDTQILETYVSYLRRKLGDSQHRVIETVRGIGYVMRPG